MPFADALASLYAMSGIAACACYGPQLLRLMRSPQARRSMSLLSWGGWLALGAVSLLYAAVLGSPEMVLVNGLNSACQTAVVVLALAQRISDRKTQKGPAPCGAGPLEPPVIQV